MVKLPGTSSVIYKILFKKTERVERIDLIISMSVFFSDSLFFSKEEFEFFHVVLS